jgi:hypothetical protein
MAEEEQKKQAALAEDRLKMAHLRKGKLQQCGRCARARTGKGA